MLWRTINFAFLSQPHNPSRFVHLPLGGQRTTGQIHAVLAE